MIAALTMTGCGNSDSATTTGAESSASASTTPPDAATPSARTGPTAAERQKAAQRRAAQRRAAQRRAEQRKAAAARRRRAKKQSTGGDGSFTMPNEVGKNLQEAQDDVQRASGDPIFVSHSTDATGEDRFQILDRDWKVCGQNVAAGSSVSAIGHIVFSVVKDFESCP